MDPKMQQIPSTTSEINRPHFPVKMREQRGIRYSITRSILYKGQSDFSTSLVP